MPDLLSFVVVFVVPVFVVSFNFFFDFQCYPVILKEKYDSCVENRRV